MPEHRVVDTGSKSGAFTILVIVVVILSTALGSFLFIALLPFADVAGKLLIGLLALAIGCIAILGLAHSYFHVRMLRERHKREQLHSRLIAVDGVVAWARPDGTFYHLSAEHEAAKVPKMLPAPAPNVTVEEVNPDADEIEICSRYERGESLRKIEKETGATYHRVRSVVANWKEKHGLL